ncbi:peptide-methionine (S)-S-oxide reductase MsrA [Candidatus Magnetaquicoccus inordinatus]|uniref:peptide-methionine (S)-S-oxide reductase MsrA n=1 Tax=Candidatus Magnetaquicoccus inordinatus TaxID=2496818 RepID=UPI00102CC2C1|nr:peptide-methionine (S)-S-oxide reductase MsrA [Candidatus Magnetaquicoccus inordinatus]
MSSESTTQLATFAGGCFWCMEHPFDVLEGVLSTTVGYAGGSLDNPSYEAVCSGQTGHAEVVQVAFNPQLISYTALLQRFWLNIDPTTKNRQFCDSGSQYRTAIFYHSPAQEQEALASLTWMEHHKPFPEPIVTEIIPIGTFWPAEEYHQKYYQKNSLRYHSYRRASGREQRLQSLWNRLNLA